MLKSNNRKLYTELLTPPAGYTTHKALGLTYSIDLTMMLSASISLFLKQELIGRTDKERFDVISALGDSENKLRVYAQNGRIILPRQYSKIFTLLEPSVRMVAKEEGSFHPKLWLIKFASKDDDKQYLYRLIVMSKNLTDSRDWDVVFHSDGELTKDYKGNIDLLNYINKLPIHQDDEPFINELLQELIGVEFTSPDKTDDLSFIGLPSDTKNIFPDSMDSLTIISPFLSESKLNELANQSKSPRYLFSRQEELDKIPELTREKYKCYVLREDVIYGENLSEHSEDSVNDNDEDEWTRNNQLHAKCYFWRSDKKHHILLGSANCSFSAFTSNHEALVKFSTSSRNYSSNSIRESLIETEEKSINNESKLFREYKLQNNLEEKNDLLKAFNKIRKIIEQIVFTGRIDKVNQLYTTTLKLDSKNLIEFKKDWEITIAPLSKSSDAKNIFAQPLKFIDYELGNLTAFFKIVIKKDEDNEEKLVTKVDFPLSSLFFLRKDNLMKQFFTDMNKLLTYFAWLLEGNENNTSNLPIEISSVSSLTNQSNSLNFTLPLYERLLVVAASEPERLIKINEVIASLSVHDEISKDELDELVNFWKPFKRFIPKEKL